VIGQEAPSLRDSDRPRRGLNMSFEVLRSVIPSTRINSQARTVLHTDKLVQHPFVCQLGATKRLAGLLQRHRASGDPKYSDLQSSEAVDGLSTVLHTDKLVQHPFVCQLGAHRCHPVDRSIQDNQSIDCFRRHRASGDPKYSDLQSSEAVDGLIILDRSVDWVTPMCTQLTPL
jgi:hypothetical protein